MEEYQRTLARQSGYPFHAQPLFQGAVPVVPHGPNNSWADVLQGLGRMSLSNNNGYGSGNGLQGRVGLGQQADFFNSGSSVNQGGFSFPDGLMDIVTGFYWSSLAI